MAGEDESAVVRLYLASTLQRMKFDHRWPILANLVKHGEDMDDNNIPRMLWFALEPMVPSHPQKALQVATSGKLPRLQEFTARRLLSGDAPPQQRNANRTQGDGPEEWQKIIGEIAPGFRIRDIGEAGVRKLNSFRNENAVQTHPLDRRVPCSLYRHLDVPKEGKTTLKIRASYHPHGDWRLRVKANKEVLNETIVGYKNVQEEWLNLEIDLSRFAGKHVDLVIENGANDWMNEFGFWSSIKVVTE